MLAILAALLGCQGLDEFKRMLPAALNLGVHPHRGQGDRLPGGRLPRYRPHLPLPRGGQRDPLKPRRLPPAGAPGDHHPRKPGGDGRTGPGGHLRRAYERVRKLRPEESKHINRWLSGNCFGDYYTRGGLNYQDREMITFCFIAAQAVRAAADLPRRREHEGRQRQGLPHRRRLPVPCPISATPGA